jgi:hypothetical protein
MNPMMKRSALIGWALMMMVAMAPAQTQPQREALSIEGYSGQANVLRFQGRVFVDLEDLARITNGSLNFEARRIVLTLPRSDSPTTASDDARKNAFSRPFMRAAIEAMASLREWAGIVMVVVQNGYPVGNNQAGNAIMAHQGRAAESIAMAAAAASTEADYRGLALLRNEFNNGQAWSDQFVKARTSLSATNMTISENAFQNDEDAQKIVRCGQFMAQMFSSGKFQDDAACR